MHHYESDIEFNKPFIHFTLQRLVTNDVSLYLSRLRLNFLASSTHAHARTLRALCNQIKHHLHPTIRARTTNIK